jgi:FAD dependent oxidoreductase TIGR03364
VAIYREIAAEVPIRLTCGGTLYPATTPAELAVLEEFARLGPEKGYPCELLDAGRSLALCPPLNTDHVLGTLLFPDDARVEPRGLFRALIPWMQRTLGVTYRPGTVAVRAAAAGGAARVETADGAVFHGRHVLVCSGADLRTLFPKRLATADLLRCKLQMLRTAACPDVRLAVTLASGLTLRRYASFRMCRSLARLEAEPLDPELAARGIHILAVQDEDGSLVVGDSHEYAPGDLDEVLDSATEGLILREAARLLRVPRWEVARRWHGVYALPRAGELLCETIEENIHLVTAIGGKGMTTGPAVARETIAGLK